MWTLSPKSYKAAFAVVFAILVGIGIASFVMSDRFANSEESVIHTHEVISELKSVSAELSEAESARRGFALIGDRTLLIDYDVALETLPRQLQTLQSMTTDNPRQQQRLAQLQPLMAQRLALLKKSIQLQQRDPSATEQQLEFTRQGVALTDKIGTLLNAMEQEEDQLLAGSLARLRCQTAQGHDDPGAGLPVGVHDAGVLVSAHEFRGHAEDLGRVAGQGKRREIPSAGERHPGPRHHSS